MNDHPTPWRVITVGNSIKSHAIVDVNGKKVCSGISPKTDVAARIVDCINLLYWSAARVVEKLEEEEVSWNEYTF